MDLAKLPMSERHTTRIGRLTAICLLARRCRCHDWLGDRWRTKRGSLASASARITEMTGSGVKREAKEE